MKKHTLILTLLFALACESTPKANKAVAPAKEQQAKKEVVTLKPKSGTEENEVGFLFINISRIYSREITFALLNKEKDTLISFMNEKTYFENNVYETMDEDGFYKRKLDVTALDPEYGLFILKSFGLNNDGYYAVEVNKDTAYVHKEDHKDVLEFKSPEKYVMGGYPHPTKENPLRMSPEDSAKIISGFEKNTYIPIKIEGDWLKVKDNKVCFPGPDPLKEVLIGWIRWRKDGEVILDVRYLC